MNSTTIGLKVAGLLGAIAFFAMLPRAVAQFTVVGPPPYSNAEAQKKIRALLASVHLENRKQTVAELTRLLSWYRDLIDDELITAWRQQADRRLEIAEVIKPPATPRVASGSSIFPGTIATLQCESNTRPCS